MKRWAFCCYVAAFFSTTTVLKGAIIAEFDVDNANPGISPTVSVLMSDSDVNVTPLGYEGLFQPRNFNNSFSFDDWPNSSSAVLSRYLTFTLTPTAGKQIEYTSLTIGTFNGDGIAPNHFQIRTSLDGFASPVVVQSIPIDGFGHNTMHDLTSLGSSGDGVEFRVYFYEYVPGGGSAGLAGAPVFGGGNLVVEGTVSDAPQCGTCEGDVNGDGIVNGNDVGCFVGRLVNGTSNCVGETCADMNGDNAVTATDIGLFVAALLSDSNSCL